MGGHLKFALAYLQDLLERAYDADVGGDAPLAVSRYKSGAEAIEIGLQVDAPETGLGQRFNNVAQWKHELRDWQQHVRDRWDLFSATDTQ